MKQLLITILLSVMARGSASQVLCDPNDHSTREPIMVTAIRGTIVDQNKAVIPKVSVLVRNGHGKQVAVLETSSTGIFTAPNTKRGKYELGNYRTSGLLSRSCPSWGVPARMECVPARIAGLSVRHLSFVLRASIPRREVRRLSFESGAPSGAPQSETKTGGFSP